MLGVEEKWRKLVIELKADGQKGAEREQRLVKIIKSRPPEIGAGKGMKIGGRRSLVWRRLYFSNKN